MELISIDEAADESGVAKRTLKLWLQQGKLTRHPRAVIAYGGTTRSRTVVDRAELLRALAAANPRYFGSRSREEQASDPNSR